MTQALRVAFRVDASQVIGTGHVRRCLALAQALKKFGIQTFFVCRRHDEISSYVIPALEDCSWLADAPQSLLSADENPSTPYQSWGLVPWQQDADQTINALINTSIDWVVVDHYAWDARWHRHVADALNARLLVIDDLADRAIAADALLDQNLHNDHLSKYKDCVSFENGRIRLMTGPRYALLSGQYKYAPRYEFSNVVNSIGIFMGGTDPDDLSSKVLLACREFANFSGDITMVSSLQNPHYKQHVLLAAKWPHTQVVHDLPDLSSFFASHDLQIGSGGGAAWERCCIGAPTLAVVAARNQQAVLPQLADLQAVRLVELDDTESSILAFSKAVLDLVARPDLRRQLARDSSSLVDGQGSERVAAVLALSVSRDLNLRSAALADEKLLLEWFNEIQARQNAFNAEQITAHSHAKWLQAKLANTNSCQLYIAQAKNAMPLGMIRFDRDVSAGGAPDHELWWLSYSVDVSFRGLGVARGLVKQGLERLAQGIGEPFIVKALVKKTNITSLKIFQSLSFAESNVEHLGETAYSFQKLVRST